LESDAIPTLNAYVAGVIKYYFCLSIDYYLNEDAFLYRMNFINEKRHSNKRAFRYPYRPIFSIKNQALFKKLKKQGRGNPLIPIYKRMIA
jgi:hypothetical protein